MKVNEIFLMLTLHSALLRLLFDRPLWSLAPPLDADAAAVRIASLPIDRTIATLFLSYILHNAVFNAVDPFLLLTLRSQHRTTFCCNLLPRIFQCP